MTRVRRPERQQQILAELRLSPHVRISALAERFGVSAETVRRDVDMLSQQGLVARAYGGAAAAPMGLQPPFGERSKAHEPERMRIAERAALFVESGEVLMIDAGSTTIQFARRLALLGRDLTVITNSLPLASTLGSNGAIEVILCPGDYSPEEAAVYGIETVAFLQRFRANSAFIGASGVTIGGIMDANRAASAVKCAMLAQADTRYLLVDHSKFNQRKLSLVASLTAIDAVVADRRPDAMLMSALNDAGVRLYAASSNGASDPTAAGSETLP